MLAMMSGIEHGIVAGSDVDRVRRRDRVDANDIVDERLGCVRQLASIAVAARRGGAVAIVDEEVRRVLGHREGFGAAIDGDRVAHELDLNAQALRAEVNAAIGGNPHELAVVRRGRCDRRDERRTVGAILVKVDADVAVGRVAVRFPADGMRCAAFPIRVEIRITERDMRRERLQIVPRPATLDTCCQLRQYPW